jgi:hypothetical protein
MWLKDEFALVLIITFALAATVIKRYDAAIFMCVLACWITYRIFTNRHKKEPENKQPIDKSSLG